jgi:hypothetical protein
MNNKLFLYWLPLWYGWGIHINPELIVDIRTNPNNIYFTDVHLQGKRDPYTTKLSKNFIIQDINKSYWELLHDERV